MFLYPSQEVLKTAIKAKVGGGRAALTGMEDDRYLKRVMDKGHEGGLELWDPHANFPSTELSLFINSHIPQAPIAKSLVYSQYFSL